MKYLSKKELAGFFVLITLIVITISWKMKRKSSEESMIVKNNINEIETNNKKLLQSDATDSSQMNAKSIPDRKVSSENEVKYHFSNRKDFFNNYILKDEMANKMYQDSLKIFGSNKSGEIISEFISEFFVREDNDSFRTYMNSLREELNNNKNEIFQTLLKNEKELQEHRFKYQMALNMTFIMSLTNKQKARIFGGAIAMPYQIENTGIINPNSLNITNGMILMKDANIPKEDIIKYLKIGIHNNKNSVQGAKEYRARLDSIFNEFSDQVF